MRASKRPAILMTLHFDIPESITSSMRLPEPEMDARLRAELAVALYAQGILPFEEASELAGISRQRFADLLAEREIPRHYTELELAQDLEYAGGQQYLAHFEPGFNRKSDQGSPTSGDYLDCNGYL